MRYALVSQLALEASHSAWVDMFGTATLDSIVVGAGQNLVFASGMAYKLTAVPEPATWALALLGAACVAAAVARGRRSGV